MSRIVIVILIYRRHKRIERKNVLLSTNFPFPVLPFPCVFSAYPVNLSVKLYLTPSTRLLVAYETLNQITAGYTYGSFVSQLCVVRETYADFSKHNPCMSLAFRTFSPFIHIAFVSFATLRTKTAHT
jgi:hypothetical protein